MSRYVDLNGFTWDGTKITSKIQEVKTKHGYMQGITVGWLWGDNVPHIDLDKHDIKVRADAIEECLNIVKFYENDYDGICWAIKELQELKEKNNVL